MIIQADTRQKNKHHEAKEKYFAEQGIEVVHSKMLVGDYCIPNKGNIAVDTKANMSELYSNLIQDHVRVRNEIIMAQKAGIKLIILVENKDGIKSVDEVRKWKNPRMIYYFKEKRKALLNGVKPPKPPASNVQLIKIMNSWIRDYGVEFQFCSPNEAGAKVIKLLQKG